MNIYCLLAGIFLILFSVVHAVFGELTVFPPVFQTDMNAILKISVYIPWHQLTFVLPLSGVVEVFAAFRRNLRAMSPFILAIILGNIIVFLSVAMLQLNWAVLRNSIPQYMLFAIILVFMVLSIRQHQPEPKAVS
jgi:hypothetical protein